MVTMVIYYEGERLVLTGTMDEVMAKLRSWCPSGYVFDVFRRGRVQ